MSKIHNFQERLRFSSRLSDEPSWVEFYRRLWPDMVSCVSLDKNSKWQRWGVDRIVYLPGGQQVEIDEKKREFKPGHDGKSRLWDDFLIEEWSVGRVVEGQFTGQKVGWTLDKEKRCDFVAYAIPQLAKCYLLPFELLRLTCEHNLPEWKKLCRPPYPLDARNNGYVTRNCAVTWDRLFAGMRQQMHRKFGADLKLPLPTQVNDMLLFDWAEARKAAEAEDDLPF